jgi:hypothetical protein
MVGSWTIRVAEGNATSHRTGILELLKVNDRVGKSLRWIASLMACWLPIQPLLARACFCIHSATEGKHEDSRGNCPHKHPRSESKQSETQNADPFRPCQCPPTCPCQGRQPLFEGEQIRRQWVEGIGQELEAEASIWVVARSQVARPNTVAVGGDSANNVRSSLLRCAVLCRFTL